MILKLFQNNFISHVTTELILITDRIDGGIEFVLSKTHGLIKFIYG